MQLSIVSTLYRSARHLPEFLDRIRLAADSLSVDYEIVFVNDDSPDGSMEIVLRAIENDGRIRLIDLSRRYGHYDAMLAGVRYAGGQRVFLIDCDLDEPPELLPVLWNELQGDSECDLAVAFRTTRRRASLTGIGGALYYRMLRGQMDLDVPADNFVARLMTRRYVDALLAARERPISFDALSARVGFRYRAVPASKQSRRETTYSLARRATIFLDSALAYGSGSARVFALASLLLLLLGTASVLARTAGFHLIVLAGLVLITTGIAVLCRYLYLVLEELRYRPAEVRRIYPDV